MQALGLLRPHHLHLHSAGVGDRLGAGALLFIAIIVVVSLRDRVGEFGFLLLLVECHFLLFKVSLEIIDDFLS